MLRTLYLFLMILACLPAVPAQDTAAILKELLDLPAPRPAAASADKPDKKYGDIPPPDDAPIEDLKGYWLIKAIATYPDGAAPPTASVKPPCALSKLRGSTSRVLSTC